MKNIFIISGPSGAGEDSIIDGVAKQLPIERVITTTTRAPRTGESQGHPYYFISRKEFQEKIARNAFIEYADQYNGELYGVTLEELERVEHSGKIGLWKVEYQGVITAKKLFPGIKALLITSPLEVMEARIRRRDNPSEQAIQERMAYTREWLKHTNIYDRIIENQEGKLDQAIAETRAFIESAGA